MVRLLRLGLPLLLLMTTVWAFAEPPRVSAQIDPAIRDRVVPAAIEIAVNVLWRENDVAWEIPLPVGSGTVVSADGLIVTNQHVIDPAGLDEQIARWRAQLATDTPGVELELIGGDFLILVSDGVQPPLLRYRARVAREDPGLDLALLRVTGDAGGSRELASGRPLPFIPIGDSDTLRLGDRVQVFSYPAIGGDALTYTDGVVSGFLHEPEIDSVAWITTDAVVSGGSSGGTAINDAGELIGVPTRGSELDCRPGDTNRDGVIDIEDIGCIPTGGSLGQLRPINLARTLLEAEQPGITQPASGAVETVTPDPATVANLDLPRLALGPEDLNALGLSGYGVHWGNVSDAAGASALLGTAADWTPQFQDAGLREVYVLTNKALAPSGSAPHFVTTFIWSYETPAGAAAGFALVEETIEATFLTTDDPAPAAIGEESEQSTWRFTDPLTQTEMAAVELTFRSQNVVVSVRQIGPVSAESGLRSGLSALAAAMLDRLGTALAAPTPADTPLSDRIVRLIDDGVIGADYYLMTPGGDAVPFSWHGDAATTNAWAAYYHGAGIADAYEHELWLPVDSFEPRIRIGGRLYQFADVARASAFLAGFGEELRSNGATTIEEQRDAPRYGDESRTFSFQSDWWSEVDPELRATTVIRVGELVALIEIGSAHAIPHDAMAGIASEQEACLRTQCTRLAVAVPSSLSVNPLRAKPTAIPVSTAAPAQTPIPAPTPTPLPTATPAPAAWGFTESFDGNSAIEPSESEWSSISLNDGNLTLTIKAADGLDGFIYDGMPSEGRDFRFTVDIAETSGWGEIHIRLGTVSGDAEWSFAVDPVTQEWYLHRTSLYTDQLFYWVEPRSYAALAPGALRQLEVQVIDGSPSFLINGADVVAATGIEMPALDGSVTVGFGAGINPFSLSGHGETFTVVFEQVQLAELP